MHKAFKLNMKQRTLKSMMLLCLLGYMIVCLSSCSPTPNAEEPRSSSAPVSREPSDSAAHQTLLSGDSAVLYVNQLLDMAVEFPVSWIGHIVIREFTGIDSAGITVYHKETFWGANSPKGTLFDIERHPGNWTPENPPIEDGQSMVLMETEDYTYLLRTPSDVQFSERDDSLAAQYIELFDQLESIKIQNAQGFTFSSDAGLLYVNIPIEFSVEFPLDWVSEIHVEENFIPVHQGGGEGITVYHQATLDAEGYGVLFLVERYPGKWTVENPPVIAGSSVVALETDGYTFMFRTPSDVQFSERDVYLAIDYRILTEQFDSIIHHVSSF